jgi:hypothetical protein
MSTLAKVFAATGIATATVSAAAIVHRTKPFMFIKVDENKQVVRVCLEKPTKFVIIKHSGLDTACYDDPCRIWYHCRHYGHENIGECQEFVFVPEYSLDDIRDEFRCYCQHRNVSTQITWVDTFGNEQTETFHWVKLGFED